MSGARAGRRAGLVAGLVAGLLAGCARSVPYAPADQPNLPSYGTALTPGPVRAANDDIAAEFVKLMFYPENGPELTQLLRYERPVRIGVGGAGLARYLPDLDRLITRLTEQGGLDIARTEDFSTANLQVVLAPRAQMVQVFPGAQCFILPALYSWPAFLAALRADTLPDWGRLGRLEGATIFIPDSATPNEVRECFEEEIAQALGPANDVFEIADTVFNDDNVHANLTRFDLLILRLLYDPSMASGMSQGAARAMARDRLRVLNPEGEGMRPRGDLRTDRAWKKDVESLFDGRATLDEQREILRGAVGRAERFPQPDHRLAFTLDMLAALEFEEKPILAEGLLTRALQSLVAGYPPDDLRTATIRLNLAQTKLRLGKPAEALDLVEAALPVLSAYAVAPRVAAALQTSATALLDLGRQAEAVSIAIDGLRWARYAQGADFGNLGQLQDRLEAVRALGPAG